jgi:hypothetical protein
MTFTLSSAFAQGTSAMFFFVLLFLASVVHTDTGQLFHIFTFAPLFIGDPFRKNFKRTYIKNDGVT